MLGLSKLKIGCKGIVNNTTRHHGIISLNKTGFSAIELEDINSQGGNDMAHISLVQGLKEFQSNPDLDYAHLEFLSASQAGMERLITPLAMVAAIMPDNIRIRQLKVAALRPSLSATAPRARAPIPMPISSIDSTTPSDALLIPHSAAIPGAAKLMDNKSKPSSAFRKIAMMTTVICVLDIVDFSRAVIGF